MRRAAFLWLAWAVGLTSTGCHAYQRDWGYATARLTEIGLDPFHRDNVKYTLPAIGVAAVLAAIGALLVVRRRR